jgi:hypothetical protein
VGASDEIQPACVDALHAHSCSVVTFTVPLPPLAAMLEVTRVTWHFTGEGPVDTAEEDWQPTALSMTLITTTSAANQG